MIRSFIAINLPVGARKAVASAASLLQDVADHVKWVSPHQYHLTLAFLGDLPEERLPEITEATAAVVADLSPFFVEIAGLGAFPSPEKARVIWLGVTEGAKALQEVNTRLWSALRPLGFKGDNEFHPHLTLGRVKRRQGTVSLAGVDRRLFQISWTSFSVDHLCLMKSDLTLKGPLYTRLSVLPLLGQE
ncbi:MAG: RNA 2',3'-cyclic phosphodiesterase [Firmicutes bacterium]|nr:RNA 2',3'-cyclic phosphodiesterase [Bacillota bacterium]